MPSVLNSSLLDEVVPVSDEDAIETAQEIARVEGLDVSDSCGAAAWAARQIASKREYRGQIVLVVFPDRRRREGRSTS